MIPNYQRPQVLIKELLDRSQPTGVKERHAIVIGPQYDLFRYTNAAEKAKMVGLQFSPPATGQTLTVPYEGLVPSRHQVDKTFSQLYGENLEATTYTVAKADTAGFKITSLSTPNRIEYAGKVLAGAGLESGLYGRDIKAGDLAYVTYNGVTVRRTVKSVQPSLLASAIGVGAVAGQASTGLLGASSRNAQARSGSSQTFISVPAAWSAASAGGSGTYAAAALGGYDRYTITASTGGTFGTADPAPTARFSITSQSGTYTATDVIPAGSTTKVLSFVINGRTITLTHASLTSVTAGDTFVVDIFGTYVVPILTGGSKNFEAVGTYAGAANTTYTITVVTGSTTNTDTFTGAVLKVSDTAGIDRISTFTLGTTTGGTGGNGEYPIGTYGVMLKFDIDVTTGQGFVAGDVFTIPCVAASPTGTNSVVVLNGQATDVSQWVQGNLATPLDNVEFRARYSGVLSQKGDTGLWNFYIGDATDGGILVTSDLAINLPDRTSNQWVKAKASDYARLFTSWRGLVPAAANELTPLYQNDADLTTDFGINDPDNVLRYAAGIALQGSQGKPIYVGRVQSNDPAGWAARLRQLARVDGAGYFAVLSHDPVLQELVQGHVDACSESDVKLWRRAYIPNANPGKYALMVQDSNQADYVGSVLPVTGGNLRVVCTGANFLTNGVVAGDLFRTNYSSSSYEDVRISGKLMATDSETFDEYVIDQVLEEDELLLVTGPSSPMSSTAFEIWKSDTAVSQATYVGNVAASWMDRRVTTIWSDSPYYVTATGVTENQDLMFTCAEIAGLRSALYPQQGLTHTQITSISSCPLMFTKYTQAELNLAAQKGVFIITQEGPDETPYIRHQLTTDTSSGSLYYEDNVGVNIDEIAYDLKDILSPYIGKRNATRQVVEELTTKLRAYFNTKLQSPTAQNQVGPALMNWGNLSVTINQTYKDRIDISVSLEIPLPLNNIVCTLNASAASDATIVTINSQANQ